MQHNSLYNRLIVSGMCLIHVSDCNSNETGYSDVELIDLSDKLDKRFSGLLSLLWHTAAIPALAATQSPAARSRLPAVLRKAEIHFHWTAGQSY